MLGDLLGVMCAGAALQYQALRMHGHPEFGHLASQSPSEHRLDLLDDPGRTLGGTSAWLWGI